MKKEHPFQEIVLKQLDKWMGKNKPQLSCTSYVKTNARCMINLNLKANYFEASRRKYRGMYLKPLGYIGHKAQTIEQYN